LPSSGLALEAVQEPVQTPFGPTEEAVSGKAQTGSYGSVKPLAGIVAPTGGNSHSFPIEAGARKFAPKLIRLGDCLLSLALHEQTT